MEEEKFIGLLNALRVITSANPYRIDVMQLVNADDLTTEQKSRLAREFSGKRIVSGRISPVYFENDYF